MAMVDRSNIGEITPGYLQRLESIFEQAEMIVLDANLPPSTIKAAIKFARKFHTPVCADPASVSLAGRLKPFLPYLEIINPNVQEAAALLDWDEEVLSLPQTMQAARQLVEVGVKTAIIPMAEKGVCYASTDTNGHIPSILTNVVDPTGAGDALTSVVIYSFLNSISIDDGVRLGVSAASLTLRQYGAVLPELSLETIYENLVI
jgi:pseudouridine kinase